MQTRIYDRKPTQAAKSKMRVGDLNQAGIDSNVADECQQATDELAKFLGANGLRYVANRKFMRGNIALR